MPPRAPPTTFILLLKTHKITALLTVPSSTTVDAIKEEALSALQSDVLLLPNPHPTAMDEDDSEWTIPRVETTEDFELAKAVKEKGRPTGRYETLVGSSQLKKVLVNWDLVFVQFRDPNGGLLPVKVSLPPLYVEEEEDTSTQKGKRKAVE